MAQRKAPRRAGKPLDTKGYYRLLKIAPESSHEDIRLAYAMARTQVEGQSLRRLEEAYKVLKNPKTRAAYDKEGLRQFEPLRSPVTLVAAVVLLIVSFVWLWLPEIQMRRKSFRSGQTLVEIRTGRVFGEVVRYETRHEFPGGMTAPAYLVKLGESGTERWFPAIDLQATVNAQ